MDTELLFDLNINNYDFEEILSFFKLPYNYTLNDLFINEKQISTVINTNDSYSKQKKYAIIDFINKGKERLISKLKEDAIQEANNELLSPVDELVIKKDEDNVVNQTTASYTGNHYVMDKSTTSANKIINKDEYLNPVETYPTSVARSYLNNLKRKTIKQTIILNSMFREDPLHSLSTDFNIVLPYYFKNILSTRLSSVQLPNTIFCFSNLKLNTTIYIKEDVTGLENNIIIPDGNYSSDNFIIVLETSINNFFNSVGPINRFVVSLDIPTQKIIISNTTNTFTMNLLKNIEHINIYRTLGWAIGYRGIEYSGLKSYITEGVYNGFATDYIFFAMNDFNNSQSENIMAMYSNSYIGSNILAMIPLNTNSFQTCFDNGADFIEKKRDYFGPINIQRLKIQLLDQYGEILDLNNMDFSFSLEFEIGYDW